MISNRDRDRDGNLKNGIRFEKEKCDPFLRKKPLIVFYKKSRSDCVFRRQVCSRNGFFYRDPVWKKISGSGFSGTNGIRLHTKNRIAIEPDHFQIAIAIAIEIQNTEIDCAIDCMDRLFGKNHSRG